MGSTPTTGTTSEWTALHSKSPVSDRAFLIPLRHSSFSAKGHARARLLGCKRPRDGSLSLPPFCGCLRSKLTALAKNPAAVCRGGIFPQGALPPMWREFSPLRSKNSLFSPTEERRQMPFGLPAGNGFPLLLLLCKRARPARLLGPKRPRDGARPLPPFCG